MAVADAFKSSPSEDFAGLPTIAVAKAFSAPSIVTIEAAALRWPANTTPCRISPASLARRASLRPKSRTLRYLPTSPYGFIAVATAFSAASLVTTDLTIEAGALYALAAPEVSQAVRDAAIERAEAGEEIGRELIAAKAKVAHGKWLPWLDAEFGWSDSTAQNYMNVARKFPIVGNLAGLAIDATALYALSAPDVPQSIRGLVGVARGCIIEIGRELVEARKQIRGEKPWEDWLDAEFAWSEAQAKKFIAVAKVFSSPSIVTSDLTIEAGALYALSAPEVPQAVADAFKFQPSWDLLA
jgi:hypothetical protein